MSERFGKIPTNLSLSSTESIRRNAADDAFETFVAVDKSGDTMTGDLTIMGDLLVDGNLTANQFIVSSSVTYMTQSFSSGSTMFGDSIDDTHIFTGSVYISEDTTISGTTDAYVYNINQVVDPDTAPTGVVSAGGSVDTGTHRYFVAYITDLGQTHVSPQSEIITTTAGNNTVTLTIPVSPDPRVTGRRLYRSKAGQINTFQEYFLVDFNDNTSTEYVDIIPDSSLGDYQTGINAMNSTTPFITSNGNRIMVVDTQATLFGIDAGRLITEKGGTNTLIGTSAGYDLTTGLANTLVGNYSGQNVVSSNLNVAVGAYSLGAAAGPDNVSVGGYAMFSNTGRGNVAIGKSAQQSVIGDYNTAIGYFAGTYYGTGSTTLNSATTGIYIGYNSKASANGQANEIVIGSEAIGMGSNTIVIGNSNNLITYANGALSVSGDLIVSGNFSLGDTQWDDMRFAATTGLKKEELDYDYTNFGLLFPQNDQTEYVIFQEQFSHAYKLGSNTSPHIHFIQTGTTIPIFIMEYRWYDNGDIVPGFTTVETSGSILPYTGGNMLQMTEFPEVTGSTITGVSSWWECKIYRKTGDGVTGDVLFKSFDIHYQRDRVGSNYEYGN